MPINRVNSSTDLSIAAALFAEYAASIADVAGASLAHQGIDHELTTLPGKYAEPRGRVYLVYPHGSLPPASTPIGCGAIRPLDLVDPLAPATTAEVKRMYIRPAHRGQGLAGELLDAMITDARAIGYTRLVLDTSASMTAAIALYASRGFVPIPAYNVDPDPTTRWFALELSALH